MCARVLHEFQRSESGMHRAILQRPNVIDFKCLRSVSEVARLDKLGHKRVRRRVVKEVMSDRV